ncbi:MAG: hypothetical protein ACQEQR_07185, partial [Pseudomonadota bacterium]
WSIRNPQTLTQANEHQQAVWVDKVLKKQNWQDVAQHNRLPGRKGVEKVMQEMLTELLPDSQNTLPQRIFKSGLNRR